MRHWMRQAAAWCLAACAGGLLSPAAATAAPGPSDVVRVLARTQRLKLDDAMMVLEDPAGRATVDDAVARTSEFSPLGSPRANLGRSPSAYWVRLRLRNESDDSIPLFAVVQWPRLTEVDFYVSTRAGGFEHHRSGFHVPFQERAVPAPVHAVQFTLQNLEERTLFIRVRSDSELLFSTMLYRPETFAFWYYGSALGIGLMYGMLIALGLYNLLLFIRFRRSYYALYIGALTSFAGVWWVNAGNLAMWPGLATLSDPIGLLLADLWMFFRLAFTRRFLHVRDQSVRTDRMLAVLQWGLLPAWAVFGLSVDPSVHERWGSVLAFGLVAVTLVPAFQARRANVRMAKWFVEATGLLATGMFIAVLVFAGLPIHPGYIAGAVVLATLLELFILSFALAERVQDLTEQREQALRHVQTERLTSLQGLVGGVTHELNSPLGSLSSTADSLGRIGKRLTTARQRGEQGAEDERRALAALPQLVAVTQDATDRISKVVRALHDFSRVDSSEEGRLDLRTGLESALTLLHRSLADIEVERRYGQLPLVPCRPAEINQVFMSLLKNAIEAMPDGGRLVIETSTRDGMACTTITDTGVGIAPHALERLFEPRLSRAGSRVRMTLGLSTAKRIVDAHQGSIRLTSGGLGRGARASVLLPLTPAPAPVPAPARDRSAVGPDHA